MPEQQTMKELEIQNYDIPEYTDISDAAVKRINSAVNLLELENDVDITKLAKSAKDAIEAANYYKKTVHRVIRENVTPKIQLSSASVKMEWHDRLSQDIELGRTVAVRGPAGNGKSTGATEVLKALGYNIYHLDCTDSTVVEQLVGGLEPAPDGKGAIKMKFVDGLFNKAFKDEKGAVLLDEFDALDPRVAMSLQSALHRSFDGIRKLATPEAKEQTLKSKGKCPIVVTMNTWGQGSTSEYVGRNALDSASLDRFDSIIDTTYEQEYKILTQMGFSKENSKSLVESVIEMRANIDKSGNKILLSTRRLIAMAESMEKLLLHKEEAIYRDFLSRIPPELISSVGSKYEKMYKEKGKKRQARAKKESGKAVEHDDLPF